MADLNLSLSENFKLLEFVISVTAENHNIDNMPNNTEIARLRELCRKILQPAREALGPLKINSGFRSEELNRLVGGVPNSDHRQGYAADVVPLNGDTRALAVWVVRNVPEFDQVILEFGTPQRPRWIHLSVAPRLRRQVLRASRRNGRTVYTPITL
ncbi:MAG: D-Ala-D-Ala carboxypeptidase family metallohydrolase [Acidobacteriota bacterium]|nr:D-Ala-D-Ala carboxypeptidase family metallohydrolase [Acidobacteriota bacterium]